MSSEIVQGIIAGGPERVFKAGENAEDENFLSSVAFLDRWNDNYYDICYSDQFCTAFSMQTSSRNIYTNSYIMWYTSRGGVETAFKVNGKFNSVIRTPRVNFHNDTVNALLSVSEAGGMGLIENPMVANSEFITDKTYEDYLDGKIVKPVR